MTKDSGRNSSSKHEHDKKPNDDFDSRLYHLIYGFGVSLAFGVADFAFLWPENHGFALLFLAILLSLLAIYEMAVVYRIAWLWVLVVAGSICLAAFAVFVAAPQQTDTFPIPPLALAPPNTIATKEVAGWLEPANDATPPNGCDGTNTVGRNALKILIGDNALATDFIGAPTDVLQVGECKVVSLDQLPDGVSVNADLYDSSGNLLGRVTHNNVHALAGPDSIVRRGDLSTLSVNDATGRELLYVRLLNQTAARIRGVFGCPGHVPVTVRDDEPIPGVTMHQSCFAASAPGSAIIRIN